MEHLSQFLFDGRIMGVVLVLVVGFIIWFRYNKKQISQFVVRKNVVRSEKVRGPHRFVQISDFHQNRYVDIDALEKKIVALEPDAILLTGDIDDGKYPERHVWTVRLVRMLSETGIPVIAILGNHEEHIPRATSYIDLLHEYDIPLLEDETQFFTFGEDEWEIVGTTCLGIDYDKARLVKPKNATRSIFTDALDRDEQSGEMGTVEGAQSEIDGVAQAEIRKPFRLVLSHAPFLIRGVLRGDEDLVLCGHTHAGQVRAPLIGALYCPGEGLFPKYDRGLFVVNGVPLYIDAGLGNTKWNLRFLCPVQITAHDILPA